MQGKKPVYIAAFATLFGLGGLGILLSVIFPGGANIFAGKQNITIQLLLGIAYGMCSGGLLLALLQRRWLDATKHFFGSLLARFRISVWDILLLSFAAGIGEEILFRGFLQGLLGIWLTNLLFIALHGYLDPRRRALFIYGLALIPVSAGFGYLTVYAGLFAAIAAHTMIDIMLMLYLRKTRQEPL